MRRSSSISQHPRRIVWVGIGHLGLLLLRLLPVTFLLTSVILKCRDDFSSQLEVFPSSRVVRQCYTSRSVLDSVL